MLLNKTYLSILKEIQNDKLCMHPLEHKPPEQRDESIVGKILRQAKPSRKIVKRTTGEWGGSRWVSVHI